MLHLDLNNASFSGIIMSLKELNSVHYVQESFTDYALGLANELLGTRDDDTNSEQYWSNIAYRIRELVDRGYKFHVDELLLTGPGAANNRFHAIINEALHDVVDENVLAFIEDLEDAANIDQEELKSFLSFSTARGAAEIAKRTQEGPIHCVQSEECRRRREQVHGQGILVHQDSDGVSV